VLLRLFAEVGYPDYEALRPGAESVERRPRALRTGAEVLESNAVLVAVVLLAWVVLARPARPRHPLAPAPAARSPLARPARVRTSGAPRARHLGGRPVVGRGGLGARQVRSQPNARATLGSMRSSANRTRRSALPLVRCASSASRRASSRWSARPRCSASSSTTTAFHGSIERARPAVDRLRPRKGCGTGGCPPPAPRRPRPRRRAYWDARDALPGLDLARELRGLAVDAERAVFAPVAQRRVRDGAVALPGVEALAGLREQRGDLGVQLPVRALQREHRAVERDRAASASARSLARRLLEDALAIRNGTRPQPRGHPSSPRSRIDGPASVLRDGPHGSQAARAPFSASTRSG
jgi:hypothetical protein